MRRTLQSLRTFLPVASLRDPRGLGGSIGRAHGLANRRLHPVSGYRQIDLCLNSFLRMRPNQSRQLLRLMPCPERFELPTTKIVDCYALRGFGPEVGEEESMSNLCALIIPRTP